MNNFWVRSMTLCAVCVTSPSFAAEFTKDSLDAVKKNLDDKKAVLIDARAPEEWDKGHLKIATSVPLARLEKNPSAEDLAKILPKDKIIYIHCRAGKLSLSAAEILEKYGYQTRPMKFGYQDLLDAGFAKAEK
jgi:rhodanese-related sulfurtransferase